MDDEFKRLFERVYAYKITSLAFNVRLQREELEVLIDDLRDVLKDPSDRILVLLDLVLRASEPSISQRIVSALGEMKKFEPLERRLVPGALIGQTLADIAGFYAAFGLKNSEELPLDHLSVEAEFMAHLVLREIYARLSGNSEMLDVVVDAEKKFLRDHFSRTASYIAVLRWLDSPELQELAYALEVFVNGELEMFRLPTLSPNLKLERVPSDAVGCPYA